MQDTEATEALHKDEQNNKRAIAKFAVVIAVSLLFFSFVSPTAIPLITLVVGFIVLGALFYGIVKLVLILAGLQTRLRPMGRRAVIVLAVCLPLALIMLQSLGQLTLRDALVLGGLCIVGAFYALRFGGSRQV